MRVREQLAKLTALAVALFAVVIAVWLHSFFLRAPGPVGFDDGYTAAIGERMIDGRWLPYVDGVSHRGPMLYWIAAIGQWSTGRFEWIGPRWIVFLSALTTISALVGTGFGARIPIAGAFAALFHVWLAFVAHEIEPAFALSGEVIAAAFVMLGMCLATWGLIRVRPVRSRIVLLGLAGALFGLAGFTKQTALPLVAPLLAWTAAVALGEDQSRRVRFALSAAPWVGFGVPALTIVGRYALSGELSTFWYWFYTYNADVYMAPLSDKSFRGELDQFVRRAPWQFGAIATLVTFGLVRPLLELRRGPGRALVASTSAGLEATLAATTAIAFVAIATPKRFFLSYFVLLLPLLALLLGLRAEALLRRPEAGDRRELGAQLLCGLLLMGWIGYHANLRMTELTWQRKSGMWQPGLPEPLCELIGKHSAADDSIFVWGFDGDLYVTCKRHVASRYTYLTVVAGTVPPFWREVEARLVARRAHELVVEDVRTARPAFVLDMPDRMRSVSFGVVPELERHVLDAYCRLPDIRTKDGRLAHVYARRDLAACEGP